VLDDAKEYYTILQPGWYEAQIRVPLDVFAEYITDAAGDILANLNDPENKSFNPLASNKIYFEILPPQVQPKSSIQVQARLITVGLGRRPGITVTPIEAMIVKLFQLALIPEDYKPIGFKTYHMIWEYVPSLMSAITDADGIANFEAVDQDDYLILGHYPDGKSFSYLAIQVRSKDRRWELDRPIIEQLVAFERADGDRIACRIFRFTGSELLIYEPEFVEWDGSEEYYPFVFESEGDWEVTTSVSPPAGFEIDKKSLNVEVVDGLQAIQFKITDKNASWKETDVSHKIKHKKKTTTQKSKIGLKLEKKLAKEKNKGLYGDTGEPGPFKGGKKVKEKDKEKDQVIEQETVKKK
jgi:hypothetical protein